MQTVLLNIIQMDIDIKDMEMQDRPKNEYSWLSIDVRTNRRGNMNITIKPMDDKLYHLHLWWYNHHCNELNGLTLEQVMGEIERFLLMINSTEETEF